MQQQILTENTLSAPEGSYVIQFSFIDMNRWNSVTVVDKQLH
jgi:hypothetical protein